MYVHPIASSNASTNVTGIIVHVIFSQFQVRVKVASLNLTIATAHDVSICLYLPVPSHFNTIHHLVPESPLVLLIPLSFLSWIP